MARRELEEINAGSMADIAFLLLIFFLVTTTMSIDEGIVRVLPQKNDKPQETPIIIKERNVFKIRANFNDQLLVENQYPDISELKDMTKEFYTNPNNRTDLPELKTYDFNTIQTNINLLESILKDESLTEANRTTSTGKLKKWKKRLMVVETIGTYKELPDNAIISLQNDNNTSYDLYLQIQNELQQAINELQDENAEKYFDRALEDLNKNVEEDKKMIDILKVLTPPRISEATPKNLQKND